MLGSVEVKIQELRQQQREEYYKKKEQDLRRWGLDEKGKNGASVIVTDEEYEALIEASNGLKNSGRNLIASLLNIAAIIVFSVGIIGSIVTYIMVSELNLVWASVVLVASLLLALIIRGIAEAVRLLQKLLDMNRIENYKNSRKASKTPFPDVQPGVGTFRNSAEKYN